MTWLAAITARTVRWLVRVSGRGQGSSLPGLVALKISPRFIAKRARAIQGPIIVITGTNGKTTTCRVLSNILREAGFAVVHNAAGANMPSGVASALLNVPRVTDRKKIAAVIEADEQALPRVLQQLPASLVVLTNLFRDQLDRYGEIDTIGKRWQASIAVSRSVVTLVANAHDARVVALARAVRAGRKKTVFFGVQQAEVIGRANPHAADVTQCPSCGGRLDGTRFIAHLGILRCRACTFATPTPSIVLNRYEPKDFDGARLEIVAIHGEREETIGLESSLLGRYNAFNILAAVGVAEVLHVTRTAVVRGVAKTVQAFGRSESFELEGQRVLLHLAKNPTGYNEILQLLEESGRPLDLVLALNDNWADGQDISWIWDVMFEALAVRIESLTVSGQRAGDLAVRLETAGVRTEVAVIPDLWSALEQSGKSATAGDYAPRNKKRPPRHVIASYTAMIFLRNELARRGLVPTSWEPAL